LQADLPYASKPKMEKPRSGKTYLQKRAVVLSPEEKQAMGLLQQISAVQRLKTAQRAEKQGERRKEKQKVMAKGNDLKEEREKRERKEHFRTAGLKEKRKSEAGGGGRASKRQKT
jgi:ribosome biogenesis protein BMS1